MIDAIKGMQFSDADPEFYRDKTLLRRYFPNAEMIELAEGMMTIVIDGITIRKAL